MAGILAGILAWVPAWCPPGAYMKQRRWTLAVIPAGPALAGILALGACEPATCTVDLDEDGLVSAASCPDGDDCDELDSDLNPGMEERCDGSIDLDDGDGFTAAVCGGEDCDDSDDSDDSVNPSVAERCDETDHDCDGEIWDLDADGDGSWLDVDRDGDGDA